MKRTDINIPETKAPTRLSIVEVPGVIDYRANHFREFDRYIAEIRDSVRVPGLIPAVVLNLSDTEDMSDLRSVCKTSPLSEQGARAVKVVSSLANCVSVMAFWGDGKSYASHLDWLRISRNSLSREVRGVLRGEWDQIKKEGGSEVDVFIGGGNYLDAASDARIMQKITAELEERTRRGEICSRGMLSEVMSYARDLVLQAAGVNFSTRSQYVRVIENLRDLIGYIFEVDPLVLGSNAVALPVAMVVSDTNGRAIGVIKPEQPWPEMNEVFHASQLEAQVEKWNAAIEGGSVD